MGSLANVTQRTDWHFHDILARFEGHTRNHVKGGAAGSVALAKKLHCHQSMASWPRGQSGQGHTPQTQGYVHGHIFGQGRHFEHKSTQAVPGQAQVKSMEGGALQGRSLQHQHQTHASSVSFEASFISSDAFGGALEIVEMAFVLFSHVCELILRVRSHGSCSSFLCRSRFVVEHF